MPHDEASPIDAFIARWRAAGGSERGNYQLFLDELSALLGVDRPQPHATDERDNAYVYERRVVFRHGDGSESWGFIDLYKRGCFVCEAKKLRLDEGSRGFDQALLRARTQAEQYARALPPEEGRPPFVVVVDVGVRIELYAEFTRTGGTYTPYPDPRSHRIALEQLREPAVRARLRAVWTEPLSLDPARISARVTRDIAARLAELARSLEAAGHAPGAVAQFLMRCLFTMFAEDVRLLPADSFRDLLAKHRSNPPTAMRMLELLWRDMDHGGFSPVLALEVLRFNGKLFKEPATLPLDSAQIDLLIHAANADWQHVEPAIFGTLLERALDSAERHALGAHFTPRAYVERLVLPTVIEPLRAEWRDAQAAALTLEGEGKLDPAIAILHGFHHRLCTVRVLDPACGSGNFLYVTLEHLKRLEGDVLNTLDELGASQGALALDRERADAAAAETVDPHNLLGIELNPRAAAIAEVVLWIGYLQWHFRTRGAVNPPEPVIRDLRTIECRDAVLACDRVEFVTDERGVPVTRWDDKTYKPSPVTGEPVPDESARMPVERYVNPRKAEWPEADFVVGNPPFIGNKRMRISLGDGYVEALRGVWPSVPESADLVMFWWEHAAMLTRAGSIERFGLITTNSIRQTFNRRVLEAHLGAQDRPLSLAFAIPDHPWVDGTDGAAVRIAMTVASQVAMEGRLVEVTCENGVEIDGEVSIDTRQHAGKIFADLRIGAQLNSSIQLQSNLGLSFMGMIPLGDGFWVTREKAKVLAQGVENRIAAYLRQYRNGKDILHTSRDILALDFFGLQEQELRTQFPAAYQWLIERVKPARQHDRRKSYRENWWIFAEACPALRKAIRNLSRFIATTESAKHRLLSSR